MEKAIEKENVEAKETAYAQAKVERQVLLVKPK